MSGTSVVNAAKLTPVVTGIPTPLTNDNSRIRDRERIKRILDWHTDTAAKAYTKASNGSGINGTADRDASKNERTYLKSANTVRYLSHTSRVKEP